MLQKYRQIKPKPVHTSLINKYSNNFHFYFSKSITQIVYNDPKSPSNNKIKDVISLSDDTEYLHRIYNYYNAVGKEEIFDRIRLISGFYSERDLASEYPMKYITNTVKIFGTRERRLRKMIASDGSSDESQVPNQIEQSYPSSGFLKSISSQSSQESQISSMFKSIQKNLNLSESVYDIYENNAQVLQLSEQPKMSKLSENTIEHLICDFGDLDAEGILNQYTRLLEFRNALGASNGHADKKISLNAIADKKPVFQSIIISQNKNEEENRKRKYSKLLTEREPEGRFSKVQKQSKSIWNKEDAVQEERRVLSGEKVMQERRQERDRKTGLKVQDIDERGWRRQKIRDKAAQLLLRVKSQNYLNGRIDYVQY